MKRGKLELSFDSFPGEVHLALGRAPQSAIRRAEDDLWLEESVGLIEHDPVLFQPEVPAVAEVDWEADTEVRGQGCV